MAHSVTTINDCPGKGPPGHGEISLFAEVIDRYPRLFALLDLNPIHLAVSQRYDLAARGSSRFVAVYPIAKTAKDTLSNNRRSFP